MVAILNGELDMAQKRADGVRGDYKHVRKEIVPGELLTLGTVPLKWYTIQFEGQPVPAGLSDVARSFVAIEFESGRLALENEFGFVVLHDCASVVFLMVGTWRGNNELWDTVYLHEPGDGIGFRLQVATDHKPCFCVWEMGAVWHETQAWTRYLRSDRTAENQTQYLGDQLSGYV